MTESASQRLIDGMRGVRYGEVLAVFLRDTGLEAEVYGTQMLNDCPQELWETLNAEDIAKDMGAMFVKLNGPRYWMLDGFTISRSYPYSDPNPQGLRYFRNPVKAVVDAHDGQVWLYVSDHTDPVLAHLAAGLPGTVPSPGLDATGAAAPHPGAPEPVHDPVGAAVALPRHRCAHSSTTVTTSGRCPTRSTGTAMPRCGLIT